MALTTFRHSGFRTAFTAKVCDVKAKKWPPDHVEAARLQWEKLHRWALTAKKADAAWLTAWAKDLPCAECRAHWHILLLEMPPSDNLFSWTVAVHNRINVMLGRREFTVAQAFGRWVSSSCR